MKLISFHLNGFWIYVKYNEDANIGIDQFGDKWSIRNGRIMHEHNPFMQSKTFYSEPLKRVA